MPIEIKGFSFEYESLSLKEYLVIAFALFHIWMLVRALLRRQWIWLLIVFFFPIVGTIIYYIKSK